jgi:hypothetical protein
VHSSQRRAGAAGQAPPRSGGGERRAVPAASTSARLRADAPSPAAKPTPRPDRLALLNACARAFGEVLGRHDLGEEAIVGGEHPAQDGAEALRIMDRREAIGKIVVDVWPDGSV